MKDETAAINSRMAMGFALCLSFAAAGSALGDELQLYRVDKSGEDGIDLMQLDDSYRKDGFEFYATGSTALSISGAITHASIPDGGWFDIVGNGSLLNLWSTGLFTDKALNTPLRLSGRGTVDFYADSLTLGSDWAKWLTWTADSTALLHLKGLVVTDTSGTPFTFCPSGHMRVSAATSLSPSIQLGQNGGRLTATFNKAFGCGSHWNTAYHDNNAVPLYIGGRSVIAYASQGYADVTLGYASDQYIGKVYFGNLTSEDLAKKVTGVTNTLTLAGGKVSALFLQRYANESALVRFAGDSAALRICGSSEMFRVNEVKANGSRFVLESVDGATVRLVVEGGCTIGKNPSSSDYGYASDLEFRGTGDVEIKIGGTTSSMTTLQLDKTTWSGSGDLILSPGSSGTRFAYLVGTGVLPHGEGMGSVAVDESVEILFDADQSFNSATGGGTLLNSAASPVTLTVGCDGADCTYDIASASASVTVGGKTYVNAGWNVNKTGSGDLTLKSAPPAALAVGGGDVIIPQTLSLAASSVTLAAGSAIRLTDGAEMAYPTDVFASDTASRAISLEGAAVLVVGGDGEDETVDVAEVAGDASSVIRKVGSNKVTLLNYGAFKGSIVTESGSIVPSAVSALTWTGGAGADTSFATLANWGLSEPVLLRGFAATFATGGNTAAIAEDTPLSGIVFNQTAAGESGFELCGAGAVAVGSGGVSTVQPTSAGTCDYVVRTPVTIRESQTWTVADDGAERKTSLTFGGALSSATDGIAVTKTGAGTLNLCATGSTSTAAISVGGGGTLRVSGDNAWGGEGALLSVASGNAVEFGGGTFEGDMTLAVGTKKKITTTESSTNVFLGSVTLTGAHEWRIGANSTMEFHRPFSCGGWSTGRGDDINTSVMRFYDTCTIGSGEWINFTLDYRAPNNSLGSTFVLKYGNSRHLLNCEWAWNTTATCQMWLSSVIDICGHNNKVGTFQMRADGRLTNSGEKATFWTDVRNAELAEDDSSGKKYPVYIRGDITGPVTLGKLGACDLTITNRAISSVGDIVVAAGRLAFSPESSWLGAAEVIVTNQTASSGAVLEIRSPKTLGSHSTVRLGNGGKLRIGVTGVDPTFCQRVGCFYIGGVRQGLGMYSADAGDGTPTVPGTIPCGSLEGPGVLNVAGKGRGFVLFFK